MLTIEQPYLAMYVELAADAIEAAEYAQRHRERLSPMSKARDVSWNVYWTCKIAAEKAIKDARDNGVLLHLCKGGISRARDLEAERARAEIARYRATLPST